MAAYLGHHRRIPWDRTAEVSTESNEQREQRARVIRASDRRFRWETRILYLVAIGLAVWVAVIAGQIQASRVENLRNACKRDSAKNAALVGFVVDSIAANPKYRRRLIHPEGALRHGPPYSASPELNDYIMRAVKTFPTFTDDECARRAKDQVKTE
jgi:hypothetical protein